MHQSILKLDKISKNRYHSIFRNNHSRKIYICLTCKGKDIVISDCFYTDRPERNGEKSVPLKFKTFHCTLDNLLDILADELDKRFFGITFSDNENDISTEEYIKLKSLDKRKYKFSILVNNGNTYQTRIKTRIHRSIQLEICRNGNKGVITDCHYYDRHYKRNNAYITPSSLTSITFNFSLDNILKIVNDELNCDFTDAIITKDSFGFYNTALPICGST